MLKTHVRPSSDLQNNYAEIVKTLADNDHVIITNNGKRESVLISMTDYAEYEKFLHEQYIYNELQKSKEAYLNDPNAKLHDAEDVFDRIEKKLASRGL